MDSPSEWIGVADGVPVQMTEPTAPTGSRTVSEGVDDLPVEAGRSETRRRIVVGIDGSPESRAAVHWALRHAEGIDGEVHAVAVWQQPIQFGANGMPLPAQEFEAEARAWLDETVPDRDADRRRVRTHLEQGEPAGVLLGHALRAELLVLGNHGRGAIRGALLGSVALRCVNHAPCPVLLVPTPPTPDTAPPR